MIYCGKENQYDEIDFWPSFSIFFIFSIFHSSVINAKICVFSNITGLKLISCHYWDAAVAES